MSEKEPTGLSKQQLGWVVVGVGVLAGAVVASRVASGSTQSGSPGNRGRRASVGGLHADSALARDVRQRLHDAADHLETVRGAVPTPLRQVDVRGALREHDGALAAFMATLLAKGVSSYLSWRGHRQHLQQQHAAAGAAPPSAEALSALTVPELRKAASEQEIDGRSSMNKDELVDALAME